EEGQEEEYRGLQREAIRRDVAVEEREESAGHSREGRGDGKGGDAHVVRGKAERLRGNLAALDGEACPSPRGAAEIGGEARGRAPPRPAPSSSGCAARAWGC